MLVICHGNINRSAAGEVILQKMRPDLEVKSAGFKDGGRLMAPKMRKAMEVCDYGEVKTRSTQLTDDLISWADLICYMDDGNERRLFEGWGEPAMRKAVRIATLVGEPRVPDPHFQTDYSAHVAVVRMLEKIFETAEFRRMTSV